MGWDLARPRPPCRCVLQAGEAGATVAAGLTSIAWLRQGLGWAGAAPASTHKQPPPDPDARTHACTRTHPPGAAASAQRTQSGGRRTRGRSAPGCSSKRPAAVTETRVGSRQLELVDGSAGVPAAALGMPEPAPGPRAACVGCCTRSRGQEVLCLNRTSFTSCLAFERCPPRNGACKDAR